MSKQKQCEECGNWKRMDLEFTPNGDTVDGYSNVCKMCERKNTKGEIKEMKMNIKKENQITKQVKFVLKIRGYQFPGKTEHELKELKRELQNNPNTKEVIRLKRYSDNRASKDQPRMLRGLPEAILSALAPEDDQFVNINFLLPPNNWEDTNAFPVEMRKYWWHGVRVTGPVEVAAVTFNLKLKYTDPITFDEKVNAIKNGITDRNTGIKYCIGFATPGYKPDLMAALDILNFEEIEG